MKYCDTCIHFIKNTKSCKLFGANSNFFFYSNKKIISDYMNYYFNVEFVRYNPQLCGMNAIFHTSIFQNKNFNKRFQ